MSIFEIQKANPSRTRRTENRVKYLDDAFGRQRVEGIIQDYFAREKQKGNQQPEQVTLGVLDALGEVHLRKVADDLGTTLDRVKQDVGLWTAIVLCDMFGEEHVYTLRREPGGSANPLRVPRKSWSGLDWVNSYTPHRIDDAPPSTESKEELTPTLKALIFGGPSLEDVPLERD